MSHVEKLPNPDQVVCFVDKACGRAMHHILSV